MIRSFIFIVQLIKENELWCGLSFCVCENCSLYKRFFWLNICVRPSVFVYMSVCIMSLYLYMKFCTCCISVELSFRKCWWRCNRNCSLDKLQQPEAEKNNPKCVRICACEISLFCIQDTWPLTDASTFALIESQSFCVIVCVCLCGVSTDCVVWLHCVCVMWVHCSVCVHYVFICGVCTLCVCAVWVCVRVCEYIIQASVCACMCVHVFCIKGKTRSNGGSIVVESVTQKYDQNWAHFDTIYVLLSKHGSSVLLLSYSVFLLNILRC